MANEDIEQKIKLTYETNADETSGKVNNLTGSLDSVDNAQKKVSQSTKETGEAHKKASSSAKGQADALEGLGGSIGNAISGMKGMLKQMWLLVANPIVLTIVAIVGGLALLFKAFTSTNDGADKFDQLLSGVSATIDILRDRFLVMAGAITKFMTGDFKGALADGKAAVAGFGAEVEKEFKQAANATKELQEVEDAMRSLGETRAKLNRDLSAAKEIITDENATYAEKKKAIDDVRIAEGEQTEQELANARRKLAAIKAKNALSDVSDEDLKKASDAQIAVFNLEKESADNRRAINKADKRADNEENQRLKAIANERAATAKAANDKILADRKAYLEKANESQKEFDKADDEKLKAERDKKQKEYEDGLASQAQKAADEKAVADNLAIEQQNRDKALADQKEQNKNDILETGYALIAGAQMLAGKNKSLQKAAIIAEGAMSLGKVGVNIATGVSKDAASGAVASVPQIIKTIATGAISTAAIISNTARALKAVGGGGSGLSDSGRQSASTGASATPQVNFQASRENQIGNTIAGRLNEQAPIRVTVLENDITKVQNNVIAKVVSNSF